MGLGIVRPEVQGLVVADGGVHFPAAGQHVAQVVVGFGVAGIDLEGLSVMGDGRLDPAAAGLSHAEVVMGAGIVGRLWQPCPSRSKDRCR